MEPNRVLIVDDDQAQLDALVEFLSSAGYTPIACLDFQDAYRELRNEPPAALITDVRLGEFNGLQLALYTSLHYPQTRRIAISGFDDAFLRAFAARCQTEFLLKPIDPGVLLGMLGSASADRRPDTA